MSTKGARASFLFLTAKALKGPFLKLPPSKANHLGKGKTSPLYMACAGQTQQHPKKSGRTLGVAHYSPVGALVLLQAGHQKQPCRQILGHSDSPGRRRAAMTAASLCLPVSPAPCATRAPPRATRTAPRASQAAPRATRAAPVPPEQHLVPPGQQGPQPCVDLSMSGRRWVCLEGGEPGVLQ